LRIDRVREADITRWIAACEKAGLILLYEADEKQYLQILNTQWKSRSEPKYPMPNSSSRTGPQTIANNCKQLRPYSETETNSETETETETLDESQRAAETKLNALKAEIRSCYALTDSSGWKLDGQLESLAIELHGMNATPEEVQAFWHYRKKKPALQYFAQDFLAWRAQTPAAANFEQVRAKRIADAQKALEEMDKRYGKRAIA